MDAARVDGHGPLRDTDRGLLEPRAERLLLSRERVFGEIEIEHQQPEVLALSERIKAEIVAIHVAIAIAQRGGLLEQRHRVVCLSGCLAGPYSRALAAGKTRQHGMTAGDLEPEFRNAGWESTPDCHGAVDIGRGAGEIALDDARQPSTSEYVSGNTLIPEILGIVSRERLRDCECAIVTGAGIGGTAVLERYLSEVCLGNGQFISVTGDRGVVFGKLLLDFQYFAIRLPRAARFRALASTSPIPE